MKSTKEKQSDQGNRLDQKTKIFQVLTRLCFLDDVFSRVILSHCTIEQRIEIIQAIIDPVFRKMCLKIVHTIVYVETQKDMKELFSHSAEMDIFAVDIEGNFYNIELQISGSLSFARVENYSSTLNKYSLKPGEDYENSKDTWTIFITNQQYWKETGEPIFDDGPVCRIEYAQVYGNTPKKVMSQSHSHICLVNALYNGDDVLGDLMRDLNSTNPSKIKIPALRKVETWLKETKEGENIMTSVFNELLQEEVKKELEKKVEKVREETRAEMEKVREETRAEMEKEMEDTRAQAQAEIQKEKEESKKQTIRSYFIEGGRDNAFIAKVMHTSIEYVQNIRNEMANTLLQV